MRKIVICEDSPRQLTHLKDCIEKYIMIEDLDLTIALASNSPQPIEDYLMNQPKGETLYFLDIDLGPEQITGIDLAKLIRQEDDLSKIVFITTLSECMRETYRYKLEALDFIIKDDFEKVYDQVRQCILTALDRSQINTSEKQVYKVKVGRRTKIVDYDDIYYFQASDNHKIILVGNNTYIEFYDNLSNVIDQTHFQQVHRSYIVNLANVIELDTTQKELFFPEELIVPVGRKYYKDLQVALAALDPK